MKKILFMSFVCGISTCLLAQSPQTGRLMSTDEANRLNGTTQPKMKDGKSYSQWVAEEKAKQQGATVAKNRNGNNDGTVVAKTAPVERNLNSQGSAIEPPKPVEAAVVKNNEPKAAPARTIALPAGGNAAGIPAGTAKATAVEKGTDVPAGHENGSPAVAAEKPVINKPAQRSAADIEAAKKLEADAKQTAAAKQTNTAPATAPVLPELKAGPGTNPEPAPTETKPVTGPSANKQQ